MMDETRRTAYLRAVAANPSRPAHAARVLAGLLLVWQPLSLATTMSGLVDELSVRGAGLGFILLLRLLAAGLGIAAGLALFQAKPGVVILAKASLVFSAPSTSSHTRRHSRRTTGRPATRRSSLSRRWSTTARGSRTLTRSKRVRETIYVALLLKLFVANRFELVTRPPLRELVGLRDAIADREEQLQSPRPRRSNPTPA